MYTSPMMQAIIIELADKHDVDLNDRWAHLRLEMGAYQPLVIETVGPHLVSVGHYAEVNRDLVPDPQVVFFTGADGWVPIEITQQLGGRRVYARLSDDERRIVPVDAAGVARLVNFVDGLWAKNIRAQGWLARGRRV